MKWEEGSFEGTASMHATRETVYFITKAVNTTDTYIL